MNLTDHKTDRKIGFSYTRMMIFRASRNCRFCLINLEAMSFFYEVKILRGSKNI